MIISQMIFTASQDENFIMVRPIKNDVHLILGANQVLRALKKSNFGTSHLYYLIQRNNKISTPCKV